MIVTLSKSDMDEVRRIAKLRQDGHDKAKNNTPGSGLSTNIKGVVGEYAFELLSGLPMDKTERPQGDDGIDFRIGPAIIDVKIAAQVKPPPYLLLPVDKYEMYKNNNTVLIQAHWDGTDVVKFMGWEMASMMNWCYKRENSEEKRIMNYNLEVQHLRPMAPLMKRIEELKDHHFPEEGNPKVCKHV